MLCFVGVFVRLVSRSDVITAQSLGYLLTERERGKRGGVGQENKEKVIKVWLRPLFCLTLWFFHARTHKVHHEALSEVHIVSYTGPLSKLRPSPEFMVTHSESQSLYLGGGGGLGCHWCQCKNKGRVTTLWVYMASPLRRDSEWQWRQHGGWLFNQLQLRPRGDEQIQCGWVYSVSFYIIQSVYI